MDFAALRREGIRHLERMAGERWTDFNVHDPGITILEQLCYVLTDLGYRIDHDVPDLLAGHGGDPHGSLYPAPEILSSHPVTLTDLRKLAIDVDGVKNAWIERAGDPWLAERERDGTPLHYHPGPAGEGQLRLGADPPASEPLEIKGLYRILIEASDLAGIDGTTVRANVARRLHRNRSLCEDFAEIVVLQPQEIRVDARVEIGSVEDAEGVLLGVLERVADQISPPVPFSSLDEMLARGRAIDEIFEGPLLSRGFIDSEVLRRATRRERINTSDLIHAIMEVPGIRAVTSISVATGEQPEAWSLELTDPGRTPKLSLERSAIRLERAGLPVGVDVKKVIDAYAERRRRSAVAGPTAGSALAPPAGRDRNLGAYHSVQHHFPATYGIAEMGLPDSATPQRKAQAKQLKAYLTLFDQLLANFFAQLAHAKDLFSFDGDNLRTYFAQPLEDPRLGLDEIRGREAGAHRRRLQWMTESPAGVGEAMIRARREFVETTYVGAERPEPWQEVLRALSDHDRDLVASVGAASRYPFGLLERLDRTIVDTLGGGAAAVFDAIDAHPILTDQRKNRFLSHMLARFAEQFADYSLVLADAMPAAAGPPEQKLARDKQAFLQRYPKISSARGSAFDYLRPSGHDNLSGLEERIRLKLGLDEGLGEEIVLVEHILLRPMIGDEGQTVPLLAASGLKDPYSSQLSFVARYDEEDRLPERFGNDGFRRFVEQTIREETPAHLMPYVHWLGESAWIAFKSAHQRWLARRRELWTDELGLGEGGEP